VTEISVVVPVGSQCAYLGEQLYALATQKTAASYEVLVVDNHPRVRQFDLPDGRFRVMHEPVVAGAAHARNVGAFRSGGDVILFCDADDVVAPGWIGGMSRAAARGLDVFGGPIDDVALDPLKQRGPTLPLPRDLDLMPWAIGANIGMRSSAFARLGGWNEAFRAGEEIDLCWRAQLLGLEFGEAPDALVHYRPRASARPALFQGLSWGVAAPRLLVEYGEHGLRRPSLPNATRDWGRLLLAFPWLLVSPRARRDAARLVGLRVGRMLGSLRWRRLLL